MQKDKPTAEDVKDAVNRKVPDVIEPDLRLLFVGINPGLYTAAVGHHFAHPANRFWKALFDSNLTPRLLAPEEKTELLRYGIGITNLVERPSLRASELTKEELLAGRRILEDKIKKYRPKTIAILGLDAYRQVFDKKASVGEQAGNLAGAKIWVLPNPSGLNASFTPKRLAVIFHELKKAIDREVT